MALSTDSASRIQTIRSADLAVEHSYHPAGEVLAQLRYLESGLETFRRDVSFDSLGRLDSIMHSQAGAGVIASYTYQHDWLNRREQIALKDGDYWNYSYNDRFEVAEGSRHLADATPQAGLQFEYEYDTIGNRLKMREGGDASGANLRETRYTPDALNQYDAITNHGYLQVVGQANPAATVTVNTQSTNRQDVHFRGELAVNNSTGPIYQSVDVDGTRSGYTPLEETGYLFAPAQTVSPTYDLDGNLKTDARWVYTWNAENRLVAMETLPAAYNAGAPRQKLEFAYDSEGRRFSKKVYDWNAATNSYQLSSHRAYIYHGWNLIAELDAQSGSSTVITSYLWGLDLSNTPQGAGGVGGLLAFNNESTNSTYYPFYDGNGNVMGYFDQSQSSVAAEFEYGPFGELIQATGEKKNDFNFKFSTKYEDAETGLLYYGFRYDDPKTGRWLNRDPIEEEGGFNLYGFVGNDPVNGIDVLGNVTLQDATASLRAKDVTPKGRNSRNGKRYTKTQIFDEWLVLEGDSTGWLNDLIECPDKICVQDGEPVNCNNGDWGTLSGGWAVKKFHPEADYCMRSRVFGVSAQQCCYKKEVEELVLLSPTSHSAGTPDKVAAGGVFREIWNWATSAGHQGHDVNTFTLADELGRVDDYLSVRPPSGGGGNCYQ